MIACSNCRCPAPIDLDELTGDGGGDPSLLPVFVPPDGWLLLPDGDPDNPERDLLCGDCASDEEIVEWMADGAKAQAVLERVVAQDRADDDEQPPPFLS